MSQPERSEPKPRSRFGNIVNTADLPWENWEHESGRYGAQEKGVAKAVGGRNLGYHIEIVPPGKLSVPYHFHHYEEEAFYVLEGRGMLRQGDAEMEEEIELGPGDFVAFPPGTGIAHQFRNHTLAPFLFLAMSNKIREDIVEYPDSDKVLIRAKDLKLRRSPNLDYWEGEA